jgi:hypothetical protein
LLPKEKQFDLSVAKGFTRKPKDIWKEAVKCILLCSNCHLEIERTILNGNYINKPPFDINAQYTLLEFDYWLKMINRSKPKRQPKLCKSCNKIISVKAVLCNRCNKIKLRKIRNRPPYHQLKMEIEEMGYLRVGKKYGVSDNAIRKWVITYQKELGITEKVKRKI